MMGILLEVGQTDVTLPVLVGAGLLLFKWVMIPCRYIVFIFLQLLQLFSPLQLWPLLALVEASLMLASLCAGVSELLNSSAV